MTAGFILAFVRKKFDDLESIFFILFIIEFVVRYFKINDDVYIIDHLKLKKC
jgi:hypothetical protein